MVFPKNRKFKKMPKNTTLASPDRLKVLLSEAEKELSEIQPQIEQLEAQLEQLQDLKRSKQRLLTLKMSLTAMLDGIDKDTKQQAILEAIGSDDTQSNSGISDKEAYTFLSAQKTFHPDAAIEQVSSVLKQRESLNFEMFKAVALLGGKATSQEVKDYLIQNQIKQPQTGEGFETVSLAEISSRLNYLIRKNVLKSAERGVVYTPLGWSDPN